MGSYCLCPLGTGVCICLFFWTFKFVLGYSCCHFFKKDFYLLWTFFLKSLLKLLQYCLWVFWGAGFWPRGMWDPGSLTRDWTHTPSIRRQNLNHETTREVLSWYCLFKYICILNLLFYLFFAVLGLCRCEDLALVVASGGYSLAAERWGYSSLQRLLLLQSTGSRLLGFSSYSSQVLQHSLSRCGVRA